MKDAAKTINIGHFSYELPKTRIARYPLVDRTSAKQLHYRNGEIEDRQFFELPSLLSESSLLVGNHTRVVHARLHFPIGSGKRPVELFCLDPLVPHDHALSLSSRKPVVWKCLIGGNRRWKRGPLELEVGENTLKVERLEQMENAFSVRFSWTGGTSFGEILREAGNIPLPPYLNREAERSDEERYQTVFAKEEGSVAAPTAGLHFTPELLREFKVSGHRWAELTLHVGAGTFKPVTSERLGDHIMHEEFFTADLALIDTLIGQLERALPIIGVGTTSLRCLESLFYVGAKLVVGESLDVSQGQEIDQWIASDDRFTRVTPLSSMRAIKDALEDVDCNRVSGYTSLLLTPAVKVRMIDAIITNFHQPRSTLLLLVAALVGDDWKRIYDHALNNDYRFLSYGDSSLLWRAE